MGGRQKVLSLIRKQESKKASSFVASKTSMLKNTMVCTKPTSRTCTPVFLSVQPPFADCGNWRHKTLYPAAVKTQIAPAAAMES